MPFIVAFSVPASLLFGIIGSLLLHLRGRRLVGSGDRPRTGLHEFARYARMHTMGCVGIAVVAGALLFLYAQEMVYGDPAKYAMVAAVLAIGPLVAWILSSLVLVLLIERRGARWTNLLIAAGIHLLLIVACVPLTMLVSALTGARV